MTDVRISGLANSAALTGVEILPLVQSGVTYSTTVNALKAFIDAGGTPGPGVFTTIAGTADLSVTNTLVLTDTAGTYANTDNFILFRNSALATVGGLTHPAVTTLGLWGNTGVTIFNGSSGASTIASFTSGGLAVTGLTSTGSLAVSSNTGGADLDSSFTNTGTGRSTLTLNNLGATQNIIKFQQSGVNQWGIYGNSLANLGIYSYSAAAYIGLFSTTGLAVTGALSATGLASLNSGAAIGGTTGPSSGQSVEITYGAVASTGRVMSYDRTGVTRMPLMLDGSVLQLTTGGTVQATLDASGNLGVGVTPSAWSGAKALELQGGSVSSANTGTLGITQNAYLVGANWTYKLSNFATIYQASGGNHQLYSAASGTAGNTITWTQVFVVGKGTALTLEGGTSTAGTGVAFPAAQLASADANTLDDYEEGTWTPVVTFTTPGDLNVVYSTRNGYYTKVGRQVTVRVEVVTSTFTYTTATGIIKITGLPFTTSNSGNYDTGALVYGGYTSVTNPVLVAVADASATQITFRGSGSGVAAIGPSITQFPTTSSVALIATITYFV